LDKSEGEYSPVLEAGTGLEKVAVVVGIPAFNEEKTIAKIVLKAQEYADRVVVCDDGSTDLTADVAERLGAEVIGHEKRIGYGAALASLFRRARGIGPDVMVVLDADFQHDPAEIPRLVEPVLKEGVDIVVGSRFLSESGEGMPRYRKAGIKVITKLSNAARARARLNN